MTDLRCALRQLARSPGFTAVSVLSLALGIGAIATVLCWLQNLVFRPLPGVARQGEIVVLVSNRGGGSVSLPDLLDFAQAEAALSGAVAWQTTQSSLTVDRHPEWINVQVVSANFFDLLGVEPRLGRRFLPEEDKTPGDHPVMVISEALWRRRFNGDPAIVGRVIDLNRHAFTIVGVAPAPFQGTVTGLAFDAWVPLSMVWEVRNQRDQMERDARGWHNVARLAPGVDLAEAQAAVATLDDALRAAHAGTNRDVLHRVVALADRPYGAQALMGPALWLLLAMSVGVLMIVAANVASLLVARAAARQKEIAIRLAAGASRWQLVRQLLSESVMLAILGGLAGMALASWGVDRMGAFVPILPGNAVLDFDLDAKTLALTLLLTLVTGVVFGLAPALQATRPNLVEALKADGRTSTGGRSQHRLRAGLVVVEVALALVLLVGAGLCLAGLERARRIDVGFDPDRVLIAGMQVGMNGYDRETGVAFYRRLRERLASLPGVEEAALASWFPLGLAGCKGSDVQVDGYVRPQNEDTTYEYAIVTPRYFSVMRIPLLTGREFSEQDTATAPPVAIINEAFARRFWPNRDPIGQTFRARGRTRTVVGVTKTGKYNRLNESPWCFYYLPDQQGVPDLDLNICVRTSGDPAAFAPTLRQAVRELDPGVALVRTQPLAHYSSAVLFPQRVASGLLAMLGSIALMLAAMGVYAVMAQSVTQRRKEFGVRMALGATAVDVLWQTVRRGLWLTGAGIAAGLVLALGVTRLLGGFLYGVSPLDPLTFVGVAAVLAAVALLACWLPARRATRVDPMVELRSD